MGMSSVRAGHGVSGTPPPPTGPEDPGWAGWLLSPSSWVPTPGVGRHLDPVHRRAAQLFPGPFPVGIFGSLSLSQGLYASLSGSPSASRPRCMNLLAPVLPLWTPLPSHYWREPAGGKGVSSNLGQDPAAVPAPSLPEAGVGSGNARTD